MSTTMSIHRALAELKTYDDRIARAIKSEFISCHKKSSDKINGKTIDDVKQKIQGNFDSVIALFANKKAIKTAIVLSNANTTVKIGECEYTITEAIERKNMLILEIELLNQLKAQYLQTTSKVEIENDKLQQSFENYLQAILGEKDKRTPEDIDAHKKLYYKTNEYNLIDPCDLVKKIETIEKSIIDFKTEVDYKLSESNAVTLIKVDLIN